MSTITHRTTGGLSGIEAIVSVAIFSLISITLVSSILYFYRANSFAIEQAFAVESARRGVEVMVIAVREASFSDEGDFPISVARDHELELYADIDNDPSIERIRFVLDVEARTLERVITEATGTPPTYSGQVATATVATYVQNDVLNEPIFSYFDSAGNVTASIANIAFVMVNLVVNVNPSRLPNEFTIRSSATIRNLKVNL